VVVKRAETPIILAFFSSAVSIIFSAETSAPRSYTSKPFALKIVSTIVLPMECISPSIVAITTLPDIIVYLFFFK
jgi:hypothetical protein